MGILGVHKHIGGEVDPVALYMELDAPIGQGGQTVKALAAGELAAIDGGYPVGVNDFTWDTDLATTQAAFAAALIGVSADRVRLGDPLNYTDDPGLANPLFNQDGNFYVNVADDTYAFGDYIGPSKDGVNDLLSNVCEAVATKDLATFVVLEVKTTTAADPFIKARLINTAVKR